MKIYVEPNVFLTGRGCKARVLLLCARGRRKALRTDDFLDTSELTLLNLLPDDNGMVIALRGGRRFVARLAALGFTPGARVTMVRNYGSSPVIVRVLDTQVALGRGQAERVIIRKSA